MKRFNKIYEKIISEIPYIEYLNRFDIELETKQNVDKFLEYVREILSGNLMKDKYGNVIELNNDDEKRFFINNLLKDKTIINWVNRQNINDINKIKEFFKSSMHTISKNKPRSQYL